ncbi:MAG TPA: helix-turn-helix domain-containing protein [Sphingomonadaceae bacterium]
MPQLEGLDGDFSHPLVDRSEIEQGQRTLTWDVAVRDNFPGLNVKLTEQGPRHGSIKRIQMGAGELFQIESAAADVSYFPPRGGPGCPHFSLMLQLKGSTLASQAGHACLLNEGELCMIDETKAFRLLTEGPTGMVIVRLPRAAVLSRHPRFERLYTRVFSSTDPGTRLFANLLLRLSHDAAPLGEVQRSAVMNGIIQLLGAAGPSSQPPPSEHWRVRRALEFIELNLSVAGLTAETVAQDQRISRRRLDQLMQDTVGHSIASHLWSRRLEQAAADLRAPHRANHSIAQIAFANGFEDAAHFTRAFKRRFSVTPGQWRLN